MPRRTHNASGEQQVVIDRVALERALHSVRFPGGIAASVIDGEFGGARFTRDTLAVIHDTMDTHPQLARESFSMLPQEQGVDLNPLTDEQPDRLPHQVAYNRWSGLVIPDRVMESRRYWAEKWEVPFDEEKGFVVWNQTDASRYVHELWEYVSRYGGDVLSDEYVHQPTGEVRTVREATVRQLDWMMRAIDASDIGLLEAAESNPRQTSWSGVMRDGYDSYFHETTEGKRVLVNKTEPVAYLESQGLAIQAFCDALKLFEYDDSPYLWERKSRWQELARELPDRTFEYFRWDDQNAFVPAVDRVNGRVRQIRLMSSVIGETFATPEFYTGLTDNTVDVRHVIGAIAGRLFSDEFLTPVGIRMLSVRHIASQGPVLSYQGPHTVWPVTQWRIADGLELVGTPHLARHLRIQRTLAGLALTPGSHPEMWYVQDDGMPFYERAAEAGDNIQLLLAEQYPSAGQSWTLSGEMKAVTTPEPSAPLTKFENRILKLARSIPMPDRQTMGDEYVIDIERARAIKRELPG